MYVYNDVSTDSRVLREAAYLAQAGHEVTVIGRTRDPRAPRPTIEQRETFRIVRVPLSPRHSAWVSWIARPMGVRKRLVRRSWAVAEGLPATAGQLLPLATLIGMTAAWVVGRALIRLIEPFRPGDVAGFEWLTRWYLQTRGWALRAALVVPDADVHHGHDLTGLPAAAIAASRSGVPLVYDSHEAYVASGRMATFPRWVRGLLAAYERRLSDRAAALVTVNQPLARILGARLAPDRVVVLHNAPPLAEAPAQPDGRLRRAAGIAPDDPLVLYHGGFSAHRGLEELAASMLEPGLERAHLVFLGYGSERAMVDKLALDARFAGRVHVLDAVPPEELLEWVADADVGAMPIQPSTLNHRLSTPNKLFECMAAGVPIVAADLAAMRQIVLDRRYGPLGAMCMPSDPASIALAIRSILELSPEDRAALRTRLLEAARSRWNWEHDATALLALYDDLGGAPEPPGAGPSRPHLPADRQAA